jgi:hypothetical protein
MTSLIQTLNTDLFTPIVNFFTDGAKVLEGDLATLAQEGLTELATAENNASAALTAANAKVASVVNPVVDSFLSAGAAVVSSSVPGLAPIITAAEPVAEADINGVTDAVLVAIITKLASGLSAAAKSTAAINLSNLAGAS